MPIKSEQEKFDELKAAVVLKFPALAGSTDEVIQKMLGTKTVKSWYTEYKAKVNLESGLPDAMGDAGITPEMWEWALDVKKRRSAARQLHADACKSLAISHKRAVDKEDDRLATSLASDDSPLIRIVEAGYEDLPLRAQAKIAAVNDKKLRQVTLDQEVLKYRKEMLAKLYPDAANFTPGDAGTQPIE
jgi:hypothetical protein